MDALSETTCQNSRIRKSDSAGVSAIINRPVDGSRLAIGQFYENAQQIRCDESQNGLRQDAGKNPPDQTTIDSLGVPITGSNKSR